MREEDIKIVIASVSGEIYIQARISRTIARRVEQLLEQNNVVMLSPPKKEYADSRSEWE